MRLLLCVNNPTVERWLSARLSGGPVRVVGSAPDLAGALAALAESKPDAILAARAAPGGGGMPAGDVLALVEAARESGAETLVVAGALDREGRDLKAGAEKMGARVLTCEPGGAITAEAVAQALLGMAKARAAGAPGRELALKAEAIVAKAKEKAALEVAEARAAALVSGGPKPEPKPKRPAPARARAGLVVAVLGFRGGAGRTTAAACLALAAARAGRRALAVDLSLAAPALHAQFGLDPAARPWYPLAGADLPAAEALGVGVLTLPGLRARAAALPSEDDIASMLELAASSWDVVVVDAPADPLSPAVYQAAVRADAGVLVAGQDLAGVALAREGLAALAQAGLSPARILLAANRAVPQAAPPEAVAEELGLRLAAVLPEDRALHAAAEAAGVPAAAMSARLEEAWRGVLSELEKLAGKAVAAA